MTCQITHHLGKPLAYPAQSKNCRQVEKARQGNKPRLRVSDDLRQHHFDPLKNAQSTSGRRPLEIAAKAQEGFAVKRDPDLIRLIALKTEALKPGIRLQAIPGVDPHEFAHNVQLMIDAGLVEAVVRVSAGWFAPPSAFVSRLTWDGCDFLDAARSESLWNKAKQSVIAPTASWTFDILKDWLKTEIRSGLPTIRSLAN